MDKNRQDETGKAQASSGANFPTQSSTQPAMASGIPMKVDGRCRIAILYSRGRDAKEMAVNDEGPFSLLFREFARL
ncbi:MAG: hypothetical protein ACKVQK_26350, partial [Burkholderiales bacterium]